MLFAGYLATPVIRSSRTKCEVFTPDSMVLVISASAAQRVLSTLQRAASGPFSTSMLVRTFENTTITSTAALPPNNLLLQNIFPRAVSPFSIFPPHPHPSPTPITTSLPSAASPCPVRAFYNTCAAPFHQPSMHERSAASIDKGGSGGGGMPVRSPWSPVFSAASSSISMATPLQLGFHMPGEFEPHSGTWMAFPHDPYLWREHARCAQLQHTALARIISQFEQVWVLADPQVYDLARGYLHGASGVEVIRVSTNDVWVRDWGPTCVVRDDPLTGEREVAAVHFDFNGYGSPIKKQHGHPTLLPDWSKDRAAGRSLPGQANLRRTFECPLHLEGGAVQSDGEGTVLVTEECLLHFSRNPHLGREGSEALLREYLGVDKVLWLPRGMVGDEAGTNGHVDNVAAFAAPGVVLLTWYDDPATDPYLTEVCSANLAALQGQTDAQGRQLRVVKVPCPHPPVVVTPGEVNSTALTAAALAVGYCTCQPAGCRLPASYLNLYIVNGGVVVPQFGGEQSRSDEEALEAVATAFPSQGEVGARRVVGAPSRELLLGGGNVHCLTQHLPAAGLAGPTAS